MDQTACQSSLAVTCLSGAREVLASNTTVVSCVFITSHYDTLGHNKAEVDSAF